MLLHKETDLVERILAECEEDHVGLWSIVRQVREAKVNDPRQVTLALIKYLLSTGSLHAGAPDEQGGFQPWAFDPERTISLIDMQWKALGRDPDIGEIVWFTAPNAYR